MDFQPLLMYCDIKDASLISIDWIIDW